GCEETGVHMGARISPPPDQVSGIELIRIVEDPARDRVRPVNEAVVAKERVVVVYVVGNHNEGSPHEHAQRIDVIEGHKNRVGGTERRGEAEGNPDQRAGPAAEQPEPENEKWVDHDRLVLTDAVPESIEGKQQKQGKIGA